MFIRKFTGYADESKQVIFGGFGMIFLITLIGTATADWSQKKILELGKKLPSHTESSLI